jgi:hypothetical protein
MGLAVKNAEVECEHQQHKEIEADPEPGLINDSE